MAPSMVAINHALIRGRFYCTHPQLYDRYLQKLYLLDRTEPLQVPAKLSTDVTSAMSEFRHDMHVLDIGRLLLYHPSAPRPDVLLARLRKHSADPTSRHFTPRNHKEARFKEKLARRLGKVLRSQNRPVDADWVAGVAKRFSDAAASLV